MVVLIILNILLLFSIVFLFINKKYDVKKSDCVNNISDNIYNDIDDVDEKKEIVNQKQNREKKQNKEKKQDKVFVGRFVTDEECKEIMKPRRSDISILLEELNNEYEHLKELSK